MKELHSVIRLDVLTVRKKLFSKKVEREGGRGERKRGKEKREGEGQRERDRREGKGE